MTTEMLTTDEICNKLAWGMRWYGGIPKNANKLIGARMILERDGTASVLPDRVDHWGDTKSELGKWLIKKFLNVHNKVGWPDQKSDEIVELHEEGYHAVATPNSSYGYIYLIAWEDGYDV